MKIGHNPPPRHRAQQVVQNLLSPVEKFMHTESSSGIVLMISTIIAMVWANSPWSDSYEHFIHLNLGFSIGPFSMAKGLAHWVNDGLMVIFFFVVGLEIKRELVMGELSSPRKAALPIFAAIGGMVVPALLYTVFNYGEQGQHGWAIPMATDIAFAVGVLALMSRKVPFALKIFLLALAIVDDLGAVLVIAFFYTDEIVRQALATGAVGIGVILILRFSGIMKLPVYIVLGFIVWFAVLKSGIHATIAGVILGFLTPIEPHYDKELLRDRLRSLGDEVSKDIAAKETFEYKLNDNAEKKMAQLREYVVAAQSPLDRAIYALHSWVGYVIMPLFALVNAGVEIKGISLSSFFSHPISLGVIFGLALGKPIGVMLFAWIAIKLNLASLPRGVTWRHMLAVGFLAGIGFTMALFVGHLALKVPEVEAYSKLGILVASLLAGFVGSALLLTTKDAEPVGNRE